jgi:DHA1 family bicyclomycin/chloramphenicol resistance-like MFS transporter
MGPLFFALALFPATLMGSCVRPPGAFLMLERQKEDTGSASALINCFGLVLGSAGILLASLYANNLILVLGAIYVAVGLVCLAGWLLIGRLNLIQEVPEMATGDR